MCQSQFTNPSQVVVSARYGAPMGRCGNPNLQGHVMLGNVVVDGGGYDEGGAYWGTGKDLWTAWDEHGGSIYFRAPSLRHAIEHVIDTRDVHPFEITFIEQTWSLYWHALECPGCGEGVSCPSDDEHAASCDCGHYLDGEEFQAALIDTEVDTVCPISGD